VKDARFLFLGTGTSAGIPMIGCHCAVCHSTDPRDNRLRCSAVVMWTDDRGQDRVVLIDAGPDLRMQAIRAGLMRCDAIFFTHNHVDHMFGLDEVRRFNAVQREPIEVIADEHTMASLRRVYQHIFERERNVNDSFVASLIPNTIPEREIEAGVAIVRWGMSFTPIRLLHGRLPVLGWRIEWASANPSAATEAFVHSGMQAVSSPLPLAYCTDISAVPTESWVRLRGLKTLVLDCLRERKHPTHLTIDEAVHIAGEVAAEQTYFVHMSHELPHEATNARLPNTMRLAHDGLELR
jgi:phosphoribosyl 1,2-cyclic phosphate phosphodiesterase